MVWTEALALSESRQQQLLPMTCGYRASRRLYPGGEMITQRFGFTKDLAIAWNNSVYFRLSKILCGFKDQVRTRSSGEKCGLIHSGEFHRGVDGDIRRQI